MSPEFDLKLGDFCTSLAAGIDTVLIAWDGDAQPATKLDTAETVAECGSLVAMFKAIDPKQPADECPIDVDRVQSGIDLLKKEIP